MVKLCTSEKRSFTAYFRKTCWLTFEYIYNYKYISGWNQLNYAYNDINEYG